MYLAKFNLGGTSLGVTALSVGRSTTSLVPPSWVEPLLAARHCDFAVRVTADGQGLGATLIVSSPQNVELETLVLDLLKMVPPGEGAAAAEDEGEFNRLVAPPSHQLWLNHGGYEASGRPLGTDFRLFPQLMSIARRVPGFVYQCCLTPYHPARELERTVRKHLAALRLESPFPVAVTELQSTLGARLLLGGFLSDELMGFATSERRWAAASEIEANFHGTMGAFGFRESPVECGDFADLFLSGLHSTRLLPGAHFITQAAAVMSKDETRQFLQLRSSDAVPADQSRALGGESSVFISYSSSDFSHAWAACHFLERHGVRCWIAPRDIAPGEAYPDAIMRGLSSAKALIVLLSAASNLSPHVHREIERALNHKAVIIPLRVQAVLPTGAMSYLLSTCQWLDAFVSFDDSLRELLARVRGLPAA